MYIFTQTWILSTPYSMIKNKAAFTISKKTNRLYRDNYKNKRRTLLFGRCF